MVLKVCVSDASCMRLCEEYGFPCYDFQYSDFHPVIPLCPLMDNIGIMVSVSVGQGVAVCTGADRRVEAAASSEGVGGWGEREHHCNFQRACITASVGCRWIY